MKLPFDYQRRHQMPSSQILLEIEQAVETIISHPDEFYQYIKGTAVKYNISQKQILCYLHALDKNYKYEEVKIFEGIQWS